MSVFRGIIRALIPESLRRAVWTRIDLVKLKHGMLTPVYFITNSMHMFFGRDKQKKKILGIWDLRTLPWSIGDFLVFIETLSILKIRRGVQKIDICIVCDGDNPAGRRGQPHIRPENFRDYLFKLLPIIATSPHLGALFQFDSRDEFYAFLKQYADRYYFFPPVGFQLAETYNFYGGTDLKKIREFYDEFSYIPHLLVSESGRRWAYTFYREHIPGSVPVTISLKSTSHSVDRNADTDVWLGFFELCKTAFPEVVFVIVGLREEVFEGLRQLENVIIAKDYGSTLSDDFAFIRTSLMYMGMTSGINVIALFSDQPYLIFGFTLEWMKFLEIKPGGTLNFATEYQKVYDESFKMTPQSLIDEFSKLYGRVDNDAWRKKAAEPSRTDFFCPKP